MENTHNTSIKGNSSVSIKLYFDPKIDQDFTSYNKNKIATDKDASFSIFKNQSYYQVTNKRTNASFTLDESNLLTFLDRVTAFSDITDTSHDIKTQFKPKDLEKIFLEANGIQNYCTKLLSESPYAIFKSLHVFLHNKGENSASHFYVSLDNFEQASIQNEEFFELYNSIKKSKERSFGQNSFKASKYKILGTCVAREFSNSSKDFILLFSKEDLLPFGSTEKEIFENDFSLLIKHLNFYTSIHNHLVNKDILNSFYSDLFEKTNTELSHVDFKERLSLLKKQYVNDANINHSERISLLGDLLNTLSHELSNPLFGLQLTTEILKFESFDNDQLLFINQIESSIKRSQQIIQNFSEFFNSNVDLKEVELIELINEVFTLTKSESREIPKKVYFDNEIVSKDFKLYINIHPTSLAQILFNLIINSCQALKDANIQSPYINIYISKSESYIDLKIVDNGPGIPSSIQQDFLKPFITTKKDGTGLGLAICQNLAEKINAEFSHKPTKSGTIFVLRLPI